MPEDFLEDHSLAPEIEAFFGRDIAVSECKTPQAITKLLLSKYCA
jgi:hypothetical protein